MPAKDIFHDTIKHALTKAHWIITHDPLRLEWGSKDLFVDLGAEMLAAQQGNQKIAVEVKSFIGKSDIYDLEHALGQYVLYQDILAELEPDRQLYLAVRLKTYEGIFSHPVGQVLLNKQRLKLIVFNPDSEELVKWIPKLTAPS